MSDVSYWQNQVKKLQANPPKASSSYYNKDFVDRLNEAQANIDNLVAEKDKSWGATQQAQDDYETFKGTMTTYESAFKNSEAKFGVKQLGATYEESKEALKEIERTMNMLPSTINANRERRLTQSNFEAEYNKRMDRLNKEVETGQTASKMYEDVWRNAIENQRKYASDIVASEQNTLETYNQAWMTAMDNYNDVVEKWTKATLEKVNLNKDYQLWQTNTRNTELAVWQKNLSNAQARLKAAQASARAAAQLAAQKKAQAQAKAKAQAQAKAKAKVTYSFTASGSNYQFRDSKGGSVKMGTYVSQYGGDFHKNALSMINKMVSSGVNDAKRVLEILKYNPKLKLGQNSGKSYKANNYKFLSKEDNDVLNRLGLKLV